jgi:hypothetical protein
MDIFYLFRALAVLDGFRCVNSKKIGIGGTGFTPLRAKLVIWIAWTLMK